MPITQSIVEQPKPLQTDPDGVERFAHVEIEINSRCDCNCWGCDRFIDVAPTGPMTVEQIEHFVAESLNLEWRWERIHILGGEPTLHQQFVPIVETLCRYRDRYPDCLVRVISNGRGQLAAYRTWLTAREVPIRIEAKAPGIEPDWFRNVRIAPCDEVPEHSQVPPCGIFGIRGCGLGLTKHGFFLCGAGASIARVVGLDIGVMQLRHVTHAAMLKQAKSLCHICGHWSGPGYPPKLISETGPVMSPFWQRTLADWMPRPMTLYGKGP